eukprot:TRINITY_DN3065_c0_g1_i9.p2 TRINITY_DN3065_c0_g1~~TRINITY_DN3065_c0_g1_i9.p2  ORF type:complete len:155 (-),score=42.73 TRINITY_DN3065_c0_g1_i9:192-656(-)
MCIRDRPPPPPPPPPPSLKLPSPAGGGAPAPAESGDADASSGGAGGGGGGGGPSSSLLSAIQGGVQLKKAPVVEKKAEGRAGLLEQIRGGNFALKKVETNAPKIGAAINQLNQDQQKDLTSTLARALEERRLQMSKYNQSSEEEDNTWSDDDQT